MKFNRNYNQRKALFKTQLNALISAGKITTTQAKAQNLRRLFDRLVTKAKQNSVHARRQLAASLSSVSSANRLVDTIAPLFADRNSGYTTISKDKIRRGDGVVVATVKLMAEIPAPVKPVKEDKKVSKQVKETPKEEKPAKEIAKKKVTTKKK